jgi:PAS domain S-box-containing protein
MTKKPPKPDDLRKRAESTARIPDIKKSLSPDQVKQALYELQIHQIELEMQNEELRRAHLELEASRDRYFELYDMAPVGYLTLNKEGLILEANFRVAELLGRERGALIKVLLSHFILPEDQDIFYRHRKELFATGGPRACELRLVSRGSAQSWVRLEAASAEDSDGDPIYRTVMSDITERTQAGNALKRAYEELEQRIHERTADLKAAYDRLESETTQREQMEEKIRQAEKMEAIGTLAGGIAHDFNNMLAAVIGFTEMAIDDNTSGNHAVDHALHRVLKAAFRGRDLVKQILDFSRKTHQEIIPVRLAPLVRETLKLLRASLPSAVKIDVMTKCRSDTILADPSQMQQVIMNLCTNAGFAMREKGRGRLTISIRDVIGSQSALPAGLEPGNYILLSIKDTGTGIEPEVRRRIFEPFFTTKEPGKGTGMGLAVAYGIVKNLHGDITVESEPGKGSTFNVFIPQSEGSVQSDEVAHSEIPHGTGLLLFVDDEDPLVELGRTMLRRIGYKVVGVTDSHDALSLFLDNPSRFDVVITDHTMPAMTGLDLARELVKVRPDIPIILCTGFSDDVSPEIAKKAGIKKFLMKPFTKRELAEAISRVLDTKADG